MLPLATRACFSSNMIAAVSRSWTRFAGVGVLAASARRRLFSAAVLLGPLRACWRTLPSLSRWFAMACQGRRSSPGTRSPTRRKRTFPVVFGGRPGRPVTSHLPARYPRSSQAPAIRRSLPNVAHTCATELDPLERLFRGRFLAAMSVGRSWRSYLRRPRRVEVRVRSVGRSEEPQRFHRESDSEGLRVVAETAELIVGGQVTVADHFDTPGHHVPFGLYFAQHPRRMPPSDVVGLLRAVAAFVVDPDVVPSHNTAHVVAGW